MQAMLVQMHLHLTNVHSLKEKRHILRPLLERSKRLFNVSIAETAQMNLHRYAEITFAIVCNDKKVLERITDKILKLWENDYQVEIIDYQVEIW